MTSKIQDDFRSRTYSGYWWLCLVDFWIFFTIYVLGSGNPLITFLLSYHVWETSKIRHATSCHVMPHHVTSCHVKSRHATWPRHVTSCHVMSRHVTSGHVTSCHVMSCHVMSRRKSRDCHTINASLSTDFFHTLLIQVKHNRVHWLSRRVPIPYRISGILSSLFLKFVKIREF